MKHLNRLFTVVLLLMLPFTVRAEMAVDQERTVSLTVSGQFADVPLWDAEFSIYRISELNKSGGLSPLPEYAQFQELLDIRGENADSWHAAALYLEQHILSEGILPTQTGNTGKSGEITFRDIPQGLYLVPGVHHEQDGYVYSTNPFFVQLPAWDREKDEWRYGVTANAKPDRTEQTISIQVIKRWRDKGREHLRPEEIALILYRDGKEYREITLPQKGRWYCTLENLSANHTWYIEEVPISGYETKVHREGNALIVTNIRKGNTASSKLPQTGALWWPVPLLLTAGLGLVLLGLINRRKEHE